VGFASTIEEDRDFALVKVSLQNCGIFVNTAEQTTITGLYLLEGS